MESQQEPSPGRNIASNAALCEFNHKMAVTATLCFVSCLALYKGPIFLSREPEADVGEWGGINTRKTAGHSDRQYLRAA